jgi:hypothetical protein
VFPVRYELNSYILCRRNSVFKGSIQIELIVRSLYLNNSTETGYGLNDVVSTPGRNRNITLRWLSSPEYPSGHAVSYAQNSVALSLRRGGGESMNLTTHLRLCQLETSCHP